MKAHSNNIQFVEALEGRSMMSAALYAAATPSAPPTAATVLPLNGSAQAATKQTLRVDGTFSVTGSQGNRLSATVDANMYLDDGTPLHFTIDAHVKHMGNKIQGTPTMVFDDGSTMTFYYEIKLDKNTGVFEGEFWINGGTGQFEGAWGSGEIYYPLGAIGPIGMEGSLWL